MVKRSICASVLVVSLIAAIGAAPARADTPPTAPCTLHVLSDSQLAQLAATRGYWLVAADLSQVLGSTSTIKPVVGWQPVLVTSPGQLAACVNQFLAIATSMGLSPTLFANHTNGIIYFARAWS